MVDGLQKRVGRIKSGKDLAESKAKTNTNQVSSNQLFQGPVQPGTSQETFREIGVSRPTFQGPVRPGTSESTFRGTGVSRPTFRGPVQPGVSEAEFRRTGKTTPAKPGEKGFIGPVRPTQEQIRQATRKQITQQDFREKVQRAIQRGEKLPTIKEFQAELGLVTGSIRKAGAESQKALLKEKQPFAISDIPPEKLSGTLAPEKELFELVSAEKRADISRLKTETTARAGRDVVEIAPFLIPGGVGAGLLVATGIERVTTIGGKKELNEFGDFLETKGVPRQVRYALPLAEVGLGTFGVVSELKTLSRVSKIAREVPTGQPVTKSISTGRNKATNFILNNADEDLKVFITRNQLSGTRFYETRIPVKDGFKTIRWVELSKLKGVKPDILKGRRILVGVELDAKGKVIAKLGGLSIEKTSEKGVSNLLTQIVRETKQVKSFKLTPKSKRELLTFVEEIKPLRVKKVGRVTKSISESQTELIGRQPVIGEGLPVSELAKKSKIQIELTGIPTPVAGTKVKTFEVQLKAPPSVVVAKQPFKGQTLITIKGEQKFAGFGFQEVVKKPLKLKISKVIHP